MNIPKLTLFVVLATSVAVGCSSGSKEPMAEVVETKDPVEEFRSLFVTDSEPYKKVYKDEIEETSNYRAQHKTGLVVLRDSIAIDVRNTDSLVTPIVGIVTFKFQQVTFTDYGSSRNMRGNPWALAQTHATSTVSSSLLGKTINGSKADFSQGS